MKGQWRDLSCRHASFPKQTALQDACSTLQTLHCGKHGKLVRENSVCIDTRDTLKGK